MWNLGFTKQTIAQRRQAGFTVLELMVATTVFAVVLLVLTAGVLSFSKSYFSSTTRGNTQVVARALIDDIAKTIQFGQSVPTTNSTGNTKVLCLDNVQYLYATGFQVSAATNIPQHQSKYGVIKRVSTTGCPAPADITGGFAFNSTTDKELLAKHMRISKLDVLQLGNNTYTVNIRVAYGDDDLFGITGPTPVWATIVCKDGAGSQFCAVSDLSTTVQQRITK
ncbi:hypothetical protein BH09PAT4_BH09PAT4_08310 [soil metagenome]